MDCLKLPVPRSFERASEPGGVWRAQRKPNEGVQTKTMTMTMTATMRTMGSCTPPSDSVMFSLSSSCDEDFTTNTMYEALWTNGPKENLEFFDYTWKEHFDDHAAPPFIPRRHVLDYLLARVTRNCPD